MKNQYDLFEGVPEARRIVHEYLGVISPPKVIANKVESSFPIKRIFGLLKRAFPSQRIRKFNPHITVARGLSPHDFQTLQPLLPEFNFVAGFICNSITLLRREIEFERGRVVVENYVKIH